MPRKLIYNEEMSAEEVDKKQAQEDAEKQKKSEPSTAEPSNTTGTDSAPIAPQDAGQSNVEKQGNKDQKTYEFKNLEGDVEVVVSPKTLGIVAGSTVRITGVGKYLSGFYYVMGRRVAISSNGAMTISLSVIKTKFGDSLKGEPPITVEEEDLIGDKYDNKMTTGGEGSVSDAVDTGASDEWKGGASPENHSAKNNDDYVQTVG